MSNLRNSLTDYLSMRRALGYKMDKAERLLGQFVTFVEGRGETHIRTATALAWATRPPGAAAIWHSRRLAERDMGSARPWHHVVRITFRLRTPDEHK